MKICIAMVLLLAMILLSLFGYFSSEDSLLAYNSEFSSSSSENSLSIYNSEFCDKNCTAFCNEHSGYCDSIQLKINNMCNSYECVVQRLESRRGLGSNDAYHAFCNDYSNFCEGIQVMIVVNDRRLKHELRDRKKDKMMCDVFGCHATKKSSFFMVIDNILVSPCDDGYIRNNALISRYNEEYLLMHYVCIYDVLTYKKILPEQVLPDCEIYNYGSSYGKYIYEIRPGNKVKDWPTESSLFSPDSKCNLDPLIAIFPSGLNSFCFKTRMGIFAYALIGESNIVDIILELKFESIRDHKLKISPYEDYESCLSNLFSIKKKYGYNIIYIDSYNRSEFCNLNLWKGIRIKEQSEKNQFLLEYLIAAPDSCYLTY